MDKLTAAEAKDILLEKPSPELAGHPFYNFYIRLTIEVADEIAALITQQAAEIERMRKSLIGDKAAYEYNFLAKKIDHQAEELAAAEKLAEDRKCCGNCGNWLTTEDCVIAYSKCDIWVIKP